ncbi:39S ribosomal protein L51, mitochondrial [Cryptotrichosporon argae]
MRLPASSSTIPRSLPLPGYRSFLAPLRKLVVDYDPRAPAQAGLRAFLGRRVVELARERPEVEVVVRKGRGGSAGLLRGHYVNGRDKVICVNGLEMNQVENKVALLLNASGAKLRPLKNATLEAAPGNESARGIWSALHAVPYRI